jgi:hypothetical protein
MDDSELLIELHRRIDKDNFLVFNEETNEFLAGSDLKLSLNGSKLQITLDKKEIQRTRNRMLRVIVLNLDEIAAPDKE